jgi:hypothetical protein
MKAAVVCVAAAVAAVSGEMMDMEMTTTMPPFCPQGEPAEIIDTAENFVIGYYGTAADPFGNGEDSLLWAYPTNKCTALSPVGGTTAGKFTCDEEMNLEYTAYNSLTQCTEGKSGTKIVYNATDLPFPFDFSCKDTWEDEQAYAVLQFDVGQECKNTEDTYGALGVCVFSAIPVETQDGIAQLEGTAVLNCNTDTAELQFFHGLKSMCGDDYCLSLTIKEDCTTLFTSSSGADVKAKSVGCQMRNPETDDDDDSEDSVAAVHLVVSLAAALGVALAL